MDFVLSPAQARALYYLDYVTLDDVDDDLNNPSISAWPPLLDRRLAARFLGVGMSWLSDISGEGPRGGRLTKHMVRGKVHWKLGELRAYKQVCEQLRAGKQRGGNGQYATAKQAKEKGKDGQD